MRTSPRPARAICWSCPPLATSEREGWIEPLNPAIYPPTEARRQQIQAPGCVSSNRKIRYWSGPAAALERVRFVLVCTYAGEILRTPEFSVVWWDPHALKLGAEAPIGIRRPELIVKDVAPAIVESGLATYNSWRERRQQARETGSQGSLYSTHCNAVGKNSRRRIAELEASACRNRRTPARGHRPSGTSLRHARTCGSCERPARRGSKHNPTSRNYSRPHTRRCSRRDRFRLGKRAQRARASAFE